MSVSVFRVAFLHRCPRCGNGSLYKSFLKLDNRCSECGLDYDNADPGDGPAVFVIMFLGLLVVAQMATVELLFAPPIWLHLIMMSVVCGLGAYVMLPFFKSLLIALQYRTRSGDCDENRLEE